MSEIVISDTSCLILFSKIGEFDLLRKVYGEITITHEIFNEFNKPIPGWIKIYPVKHRQKIRQLEKFVDKGEASAIALSLEIPDSLIICDDKKGRKLAKKLNLRITGSLGTLLKAKQLYFIPEISTYLMKLKEINFRISPELEQKILAKAGE